MTMVYRPNVSSREMSLVFDMCLAEHDMCLAEHKLCDALKIKVTVVLH